MWVQQTTILTQHRVHTNRSEHTESDIIWPAQCCCLGGMNRLTYIIFELVKALCWVFIPSSFPLYSWEFGSRMSLISAVPLALTITIVFYDCRNIKLWCFFKLWCCLNFGAAYNDVATAAVRFSTSPEIISQTSDTRSWICLQPSLHPKDHDLPTACIPHGSLSDKLPYTRMITTCISIYPRSIPFAL